MPGAGRLGDKAQVIGPGDAHGCPACPHPAVGPAIIGSPTVNVNGRPALRVDDRGIHAACCGPNTWTATHGAPSVFINGKAAFRMNDLGQACGGITRLIEGSSNVIVGDDAGSASGAASPPASRAASANAAPSPAIAAAGAARSEPGAGGAAGERGASNPASSAARSPAVAPVAPVAPPEHQLEVQLINVAGIPQRGVRYEVTLPDGTVKTGTSGADGYIRISGLTQTGDARLALPDLDAPS